MTVPQATVPRLATIGYEHATLPDVIARLKAAGVEQLIDVRAVASSRRPGFSKTMLAASLEAEGIAYRHLRGLGTPKAGRQAAHAGRFGEMQAIYKAHLETPEAVAEMAQACALAAERPSALLCYEADAAHCHRTIVADVVRAEIGCAVVDL